MLRRLLFLGFLLVISCSRGPKARPGDLDVVWRGAERGRFIAPLQATHCPESGLVELLAIRGDTGVGAALYLKDHRVVEPTDYPVVPGSQLDEPRPGATAGLRWFATTSISAFEGAAGKINLESTGRMLQGTFDVKFQALDTPDSLRMIGSFTQVPVTLADSGCGLIRKRYKM